MSGRSKIYFASDLHLGAPDAASSLKRELRFVKWLETIRPEVAELYLLGDLFDFWFEYNKAVPKGYVRLLGKLAELADEGVKIHYFVGNHDLWAAKYFTEQFGATMHYGPIDCNLMGHQFHIAHGDGLGPGDHGYKFIKRIFTNPLAKWSFHRLHPNFGIGLANFFSRKSRQKTGQKDAIDFGEKEFLYIYANEMAIQNPKIDYFVFGHRHLPRIKPLENGKSYINIGDWITYFTFLEVDENGVNLLQMANDGHIHPFQWQ